MAMGSARIAELMPIGYGTSFVPMYAAATRVGNFSEQVWGVSVERHHRIPADGGSDRLGHPGGRGDLD
jgi:hypothetical protein